MTPLLDSDKKVALVTGGGSGIGAATTAALTAAGWEAVICGRRRHLLDAVAARTGALAVDADLTDPDAVGELVDRVVTRFGRLDGLVLNAGIVRSGHVGELTDQHWDAMVETNLSAPFRLLRAALPHIVDARGAIVGISSVSALRASNGTPGYNATKAGLNMLLQSVAVDFGPSGVRANSVCPGWTRTEMADEEMDVLGDHRGIDREHAYQLATSLVPLARAASAAEVADVVAWLLSPAAAYVNGAVIPVDGGHSVVDAGSIGFDSAARTPTFMH